MECYATPWPLWRESRILWHIVELSFDFEGCLSPSPSLIGLPFLSLGGLMHNLSLCAPFCSAGCERKTSLKPCFSLFFSKKDFSHRQKLWTNLDKRKKQTLRSTKYILSTNYQNFTLKQNTKIVKHYVIRSSTVKQNSMYFFTLCPPPGARFPVLGPLHTGTVPSSQQLTRPSQVALGRVLIRLMWPEW